jgi:hypothetical protein
LIAFAFGADEIGGCEADLFLVPAGFALGGGEGARSGDRLGDGGFARGEARELAMETALEMVWMQLFGPPNHNRRPEHYDVQGIAVWVFGWGSPSYTTSTKTKRHE